jgi:hypothetical protein
MVECSQNTTKISQPDRGNCSAPATQPTPSLETNLHSITAASLYNSGTPASPTQTLCWTPSDNRGREPPTRVHTWLTSPGSLKTDNGHPTPTTIPYSPTSFSTLHTYCYLHPSRTIMLNAIYSRERDLVTIN